MSSSLFGGMGAGTNTGQPSKPTFTGGNLGKGNKLRSMPNFTSEQMDLFQSLFGNVGPESFTSKLAGGNEETFNQMEEPAMRQFSGLQGNIASRFSGMGSGSRKSSGFQNTMNAASSDFASDLQSKRMGLQQNALKDLMSMSGQLMGQRPYDNYVEKKPPTFWESLMSSLGESAGSLPQAYVRSQMGGM